MVTTGKWSRVNYCANHGGLDDLADAIDYLEDMADDLAEFNGDLTVENVMSDAPRRCPECEELQAEVDEEGRHD